tara:strand:+ start:731 stop:1183 length:453 start_codon:yes stop_codon:yes gene_type:complete
MPSLTFNDGIDEEANEFHQLEAGWYTGFLSESYFKEFKSGNGTSLVFEIQVDNKGRSRKLFSYNTWIHKTSPEAEKWGQIAVKNFMRACGKASADSTEECHNIPVSVKVEVGEKFNQVKGYRKIQSNLSSVVPEKVKAHAATFDDDDIPF